MAKSMHIGRPRDSFVWDHFIYVEEREKSVCQVPLGEEGSICGKEINGRYPTNLKAHLKHAHPIVHAEIQRKNEEKEKEKSRRKSGEGASTQLKLSQTHSLRGGTKYAKESPRNKSITRKLATFVAIANVPNSIVDNEEFRELLAELDDRYVVPGRTLISTEMDRLLVDLKAKVLARMNQARKVAICVDIWSKKGLTASFLGVTAHFFTPQDHKRHRVTLAVRRLASPHTADHVEAVVEEVLAEWEVPKEKINAILTDNGSNMIKAFREWLDELQEADEDLGEDEAEEKFETQSGGNSPSSMETDDENGEEFDGTSEAEKDIDDFDHNEVEHNTAFILHKRLSCFSHSLQLVVRKFDTVKAPKRALSIAHKLVSKVCKSVKATERLISLSGHKLVNDVPTRWNSTFIMISRLLEVRTELSKVLQELSWNNLQNSEWKQLENLHSLLKPFAKYTALTSGEDYTTISMVIPVLMELNCHLDAMKEVPGVRQVASVLQRELSLRFANVLQPQVAGFNPVFVKATLLDPRYCILLDKEQLQHAKAELLREFSDKEETVEETVAGSDSEAEVEPEEEPPSKRFHYLTSIIKEKRKQQGSNLKTPLSPIGNEEIVRYLESCPNVNEKVDPVEFWIENEKTYPSMAPLACDLLIIPASSAPIERVFSTAGQITSGKRNRLNDRNLEREVLLKKNKVYICQ